METCRRCSEFEGNEELKHYIGQYVNNLDESLKCSEEDYKKRLNQCEFCEKLVNSMCSLCGCFVLVRAVKKDLSCPYPFLNKWKSGE